MSNLQIEQTLEEKIRTEIEMMLCRVRILELEARQECAVASVRKRLSLR